MAGIEQSVDSKKTRSEFRYQLYSGFFFLIAMCALILLCIATIDGRLVTGIFAGLVLIAAGYGVFRNNGKRNQIREMKENEKYEKAQEEVPRVLIETAAVSSESAKPAQAFPRREGFMADIDAPAPGEFYSLSGRWDLRGVGLAFGYGSIGAAVLAPIYAVILLLLELAAQHMSMPVILWPVVGCIYGVGIGVAAKWGAKAGAVRNSRVSSVMAAASGVIGWALGSYLFVTFVLSYFTIDIDSFKKVLFSDIWMIVLNLMNVVIVPFLAYVVAMLDCAYCERCARWAKAKDMKWLKPVENTEEFVEALRAGQFNLLSQLEPIEVKDPAEYLQMRADMCEQCDFRAISLISTRKPNPEEQKKEVAIVNTKLLEFLVADARALDPVVEKLKKK